MMGGDMYKCSVWDDHDDDNNNNNNITKWYYNNDNNYNNNDDDDDDIEDRAKQAGERIHGGEKDATGNYYPR